MAKNQKTKKVMTKDLNNMFNDPDGLNLLKLELIERIINMNVNDEIMVVLHKFGGGGNIYLSMRRSTIYQSLESIAEQLIIDDSIGRPVDSKTILKSKLNNN